MAKNEITGDEIKSRVSSVDYLEGWDRIFGSKDNLGRYPPTPDKPVESTTKEKDESSN